MGQGAGRPARFIRGRAAAGAAHRGTTGEFLSFLREEAGFLAAKDGGAVAPGGA